MDTQARIDAYLDELESSLSDVPTSDRQAVVADVRLHIEEEIAELGHPASDADVLNILERLGSPSEARGRQAESVEQSARQGDRSVTYVAVSAIAWVVGVFFAFHRNWTAVAVAVALTVLSEGATRLDLRLTTRHRWLVRAAAASVILIFLIVLAVTTPHGGGSSAAMGS